MKKNEYLSLESGVIGRRAFIESAGKVGAGIILSSLPLIESCSKGNLTTPELPEPPKPVQVDLKFTVYNHMQGLAGTFFKEKLWSNSKIILNAADLIANHSMTNTDNTRITVRQENFGASQGYSNTGSLEFTVSSQNSNYDVYLFDMAGKDLYDICDFGYKWNIGLANGPREQKVQRRDSDKQTGEERVWGGAPVPEIGNFGVFDQYNAVLAPSWANFRYGHFERQTNSAFHFTYGFGNCNGRESWYFYPDMMGVSVNSKLVPDIMGQVARGLGVVFDHISGWDHLTGDETYTAIQQNGVLTNAAKCLIAYLFVK